MIDAIVFKLQTGSQWVYLPERCGNWRDVYNLLRMWAVDGTWERVFVALMARADVDEDLDWVVLADSPIVRAHQHAGGARRGPRPEGWARVVAFRVAAFAPQSGFSFNYDGVVARRPRAIR